MLSKQLSVFLKGLIFALIYSMIFFVSVAASQDIHQFKRLEVVRIQSESGATSAVKIVFSSADPSAEDFSAIDLPDLRGVEYRFTPEERHISGNTVYYEKMLPFRLSDPEIGMIRDSIDAQLHSISVSSNSKTPMAGATSSHAGEWTGSTDQGYDVKFYVTGDRVTRFEIKIRLPSVTRERTIYAEYVISDNQFTISGHDYNSIYYTYDDYAFVGTFTDESTCQGTWSDEYGPSSGNGTWNTHITGISVLPRSFRTGNVSCPFNSPVIAPAGIAYGNAQFWISNYADGISKVDLSGILIESFDPPGTWTAGLAFDGEYLWNVDDLNNKIFRINKDTGEIVSQFNAPGSGPGALTFDGTYLWCADESEEKVYRLDTAGNVVSSFDTPESEPAGIAFDGSFLWLTDRSNALLYQLSTNGTVINTFDAPGPEPMGLTFDGTFLWSADTMGDKFYKFRPPVCIHVGSSQVVTFATTNTGKNDLSINTLTIDGPDASGFSIKNDFCSGATLSPAAQCTFDVVFEPLSAGEKTAELKIFSNDPDTPYLYVPLNVKVGDPPMISGDVNQDGRVDMRDTILVLQVLATMAVPVTISDVNGDGRIGIEEALYIMKVAAGILPPDIDDDGDGYTALQGDCDTGDPDIHPGATEICNGLDDNCDGNTDEGTGATFYRDSDTDTYGDPDLAVTACKAPDGYVADHTDCDDTDPGIHPGATETECDDIDQDCSGSDLCSPTETWSVNIDSDAGDGTYTFSKLADGRVIANGSWTYYGSPGNIVCPFSNAEVTISGSTFSFIGSGTATAEANGGTSAFTNEVHGTFDTNGHGSGTYEIDFTDGGWPTGTGTWTAVLTGGGDVTQFESLYYRDSDSDTYGDPGDSTTAYVQPEGYVTDNTDCDDTDAAIHPGATEVQGDGIDQDCNGSDLPITETWSVNDADTWTFAKSSAGAILVSGSLTIYTSIYGNIICPFEDTPVTISGSAFSFTAAGTATVVIYGTNFPFTNEVHGTFDTSGNSNGTYSAKLTGLGSPDGTWTGLLTSGGGVIKIGTTYYRDSDGDTYGDPDVSVWVSDYTQPDGYVSDNTDCDDTNAGIHPGATEVQGDGIDQDCNGSDLCLSVTETWSNTDDSGAGGGTFTFTKSCTGDVTVSGSSTTHDPTYGDIIFPFEDMPVTISGSTFSFTAVGTATFVNYNYTTPYTAEANGTFDASGHSSGDYLFNFQDVGGSVSGTWTGVLTSGSGVTQFGVTYYQDSDGDTYGDPDVSVSAYTQPDGYVTDDTDCDDNDPDIHPGATETKCDDIDQDCNGSDLCSPTETWTVSIDLGAGTGTYTFDKSTDGTVTASGSWTYHDDVYGNIVCPFDNAPVAMSGSDFSFTGVGTATAVSYSQTSPFSNAVHGTFDSTGHAQGSYDIDFSAGGWPTGSGNWTADLTDGSGVTQFEATWYRDSDGDTYGDPEISMGADVQPDGYVADNTDCDDTHSDIHPGAMETECDDIDQDCSGSDLCSPTETWSVNIDSDAGDGTYTFSKLADGRVIANGSWTYYGSPGNIVCPFSNAEVTISGSTFSFIGSGTATTEANGATSSFTNTVNGTFDAPGQSSGLYEIGFTEAGWPATGTGSWTAALKSGGGVTQPETTYYRDNDGDTYGDPDASVVAYLPPDGYVADHTDCNDTDGDINPGAPEVLCDGIDQDCTGSDACPDGATETWTVTDDAGAGGGTCTFTKSPAGKVTVSGSWKFHEPTYNANIICPFSNEPVSISGSDFSFEASGIATVENTTYKINYTNEVHGTFDTSGHSNGTYLFTFPGFGTGGGNWSGSLTSGSGVTQ